MLLTPYIMKRTILLFVISWVFCIGNIAQAQWNEQCKTCFTSEITKATKRGDHCTDYELTVSRKEECDHDYDLSHITVAVPTCTKVTVKDRSDDGDKEGGDEDKDEEGDDEDKEGDGSSVKLAYDTSTGLYGFQIDDLSSYGSDSKDENDSEDEGESSSRKSYIIRFSLYDSSCKPVPCWKPLVAYKSKTCFKIDTLKTTCQVLKAHLVKKNDTCFGSANGSLTVMVDVGVPPYQYTWSTGATTSSIQNIGIGNYTVNIKDANSAQLSLTATITQPDSIAIASIITDASCSGQTNGAIDITVTGGNGKPYSFGWSNGATAEDLGSLKAGLYIVTVTDSLGCQAVARFIVNNTKQLVLAPSIQLPGCNQGNGSISVMASAGTEPYSFAWSNGATTPTISNLGVGSYSITVTDSAGCSISGTYFLREKNTLRVSSSVTPTTCLDNSTGAIDITVTGGNPPYSFTWSTGATTEDINQLKAGIYSVTVKDSLGCQFTSRISVFKTSFDVKAQITQPKCFGDSTGSISLTPLTGVAPYKYGWSNGATASSISGLADGIYTVTVTDSTGCAKVLVYEIAAPLELIATASVVPVSCNQNSIELNVTGGTVPYQFLWSTGAVTQNITGVPTGLYTVDITDANGCKTHKDVTIDSTATWTCLIVPPPSSPVCLSLNNKIVTSVTGASSYQWQMTSTDNSWIIQGGTTGDTLTYTAGKKSSSATFTLTILKNGCEQSCSYTISACSSGSAGEDDDDDEEDDDDCDACFSSSITKTSDDGTRATYTMNMSKDDDCSSDLSDFEVAIPCGEVTDYSDGEHRTVIVSKDPITGLSVLKVDKASNEGKGISSSTLRFSISYSSSDEESLKKWKPVVSYQTERCHSHDTLSMESYELHTNVYPNPFNGSFTIDVMSDKDETVMVDIFDSHGVKVCEPLQRTVVGGVKSVIKIDGSHLRPDLYFYKINSSKGSTTGKLLKTD
jgi:SprB repeat/Secretion system C-terminal sorting domain